LQSSHRDAGRFLSYIFSRDTYLYTIVVKNRDTGFGVPVAFFLTKDPKWHVLEGWLKALKNKMDELCEREFQPAVVITDQGQTEINAIQAVWPLGTRIFYCAWHILQAWERKLTVQNLGSSNLSTVEKDHRKRKASIHCTIDSSSSFAESQRAQTMLSLTLAFVFKR